MDEFVDAAEILRTVKEFVQQLSAGLEPKAKYDAQVAIYLLDIVTRELADRGREMQIGMDRAAIEKLCEDIRAGRHDADWDRTLDGVLSDTIRRVKIVRPDHLSREHRDD